jgi:hypothetical protein
MSILSAASGRVLNLTANKKTYLVDSKARLINEFIAFVFARLAVGAFYHDSHQKILKRHLTG